GLSPGRGSWVFLRRGRSGPTVLSRDDHPTKTQPPEEFAMSRINWQTWIDRQSHSSSFAGSCRRRGRRRSRCAIEVVPLEARQLLSSVPGVVAAPLVVGPPPSSIWYTAVDGSQKQLSATQGDPGNVLWYDSSAQLKQVTITNNSPNIVFPYLQDENTRT